MHLGINMQRGTKRRNLIEVREEKLKMINGSSSKARLTLKTEYLNHGVSNKKWYLLLTSSRFKAG